MTYTMLTVRVGQGLRTADGEPVPTRVKLTPSETMRNGSSVVISGVVLDVGLDGTLGRRVAANDDPATTPTGTKYFVEIHPQGAVPLRFEAVLRHDAPDGVVDLLSLDAPGGGTVGDLFPPIFSATF